MNQDLYTLAEKSALWDVVREFAPDYKPDWTNGSEQKWYIHFDEHAKNWGNSNNQFMRNVTAVYMPKNVAEDLVRKLNRGEVML